MALNSAKLYQAGGNFFSVNLFDQVMKGVPYRKRNVMDHKVIILELYNSGEPFYYEDVITAAVFDPNIKVDSAMGKLLELSPEEIRHAAVFACAECIKAGASEDDIKKWRQYFLTVTLRIRLVEKGLLWFHAQKARSAITGKNDLVQRSGFQLVCEICIYKDRLQKERGGNELTPAMIAAEYAKSAMQAESEEQVSETMVDMAVTVWKRAFSLDAVLEVVRDGEEKWGLKSVFAQISKMQVIVQKARTPEKIAWSFCAIYDGFVTNALKDTGVRYLQGSLPENKGKGLVDEMIFKMEFRDHFLEDWLGGRPLATDEKVAIRKCCLSHEYHRKMCGCSFSDAFLEPSLTWRSSFGASANAVIEFLEVIETNRIETNRIP